jgi:hypothetical protein
VTWDQELEVIRQVARRRGIDWALLAALRKAENGGPQRPNPNPGGNPYLGGEFGVQTYAAPTFAMQANVAANSIRNRLREYHQNPFDQTTHPRLCYRIEFVEGFSHRWAPPAAHALNEVHARNLWGLYQRFAAEDV